MLLRALQRGCLARLTEPVHRYLIENNNLRKGISHSYVRNFRERWMFDPDPMRRHQGARRFSGRVAEVQCACWLEAHDWKIINLEAGGAGSDIQATDASEMPTAFEVKFIGLEDIDFSMILRSIAEGSSAQAVSTCSGVNYLLFRVYEAAKQLATFNGRRVAVMVIDDMAWVRIEMPIENDYIDWTKPAFLDAGPAWETFLREKEVRYPDIRTALHPVVRGIDTAWVVTRSHEYEYHLESELPVQQGERC